MRCRGPGSIEPQSCTYSPCLWICLGLSCWCGASVARNHILGLVNDRVLKQQYVNEVSAERLCDNCVDEQQQLTRCPGATGLDPESWRSGAGPHSNQYSVNWSIDNGHVMLCWPTHRPVSINNQTVVGCTLTLTHWHRHTTNWRRRCVCCVRWPCRFTLLAKLFQTRRTGTR